MQKSLVVDFWLGSKYTSVISKNLLPHRLYYHETMSPLRVAVIFDNLHLVIERRRHRERSVFLKILKKSQENTCAEVSTYQVDSQSMGRPDKHKKKPLEVFRKRRRSQKLSKSHRKKPVLESLFSKAAANQACYFTKIRVQYNFVKLLKTPILKNICRTEQMLKNNWRTDASTDKRQQETHALLGKKNKSHLVNVSRGKLVLHKKYNYLDSTQLLNWSYSAV